MPRRRNIACAAKARGRHGALIRGCAARLLTAHVIQPASYRGETAGLPRRTVRPGKQPRPGNKAHGKTRQNKGDGGLAQINSPPRLNFHRASFRLDQPTQCTIMARGARRAEKPSR